MPASLEHLERDPDGQEQGHMREPPPQPLDFNADGWTETGRIRARASWFFGLAVIEQLWKRHDGTHEWRRIDGPISLREPA